MEIQEVDEQKIIIRKIPNEKKWYNYKTNDILYGFMVAYGKVVKDTKELIYTYDDLNRDIPDLKKLLDVADKRTIVAQINKWTDKELGGYIIDDKENQRYKILNLNKNYMKVDKELIKFLVDTGNKFTISVYCYLLARYCWKLSTGEKYEFTKRGILEAFGYSKNTANRADITITNILTDLKIKGLIDYHAESVLVPSPMGNIMTTHLVLDKVSYVMPEKITKEKEKLPQESEELVEIPAPLEIGMEMEKKGFTF